MSARRSVRKVRSSRRILRLEQMERRELLTIFMVTNNGDAGNGTLRQAIQSANSNPGANTINFNLPSNELTINPVTALPALTNSGITLDATTQPNWNGSPLVMLNGSKVPTNTVALSVTGGGSTIKGLVIQNWVGAAGTGLSLSGSGGDLVQDCYIGTDVTGEMAVGNGGDGIDITNNSNTIGGTTSATRNLISGNAGTGIFLENATATGNVMEGNYIGVDALGAKAIANSAEGIASNAAVGNQIGGVVPGSGNLISGNTAIGVLIQGTGTTSTTIQGNLIGTDASGTQRIPNIAGGIIFNGAAGNSTGGNTAAAANIISGNGDMGILIQGASAKQNLVVGNKIGVTLTGGPLGNAAQGILVNGANNDVIGGATAAQGNVIAYNGVTFNSDFGIDIMSGSGIEVLSNSIFSNAGGGLNVSQGSNAVPGTTITQPAPFLSSVQTGAGQTEVVGSLGGSDSNANYIIQFFSNPSQAMPGQEEGQTLLGSISVMTDANGAATFDVRLPISATVGNFVTATATELTAGNTSPFSSPGKGIIAAPLTDLSVAIVPSPTNILLLGQPETYTVTVTNAGPDPATGVSFTNTLDTNSTYVSAVGPGKITQANGVITDVLGALAANASATLVITITPIATGSVSLTSVVTGNEIDPTPANNSTSAMISVVPAADLQVSLTSTPNPVALDSPVTYVATIFNAGPSPATAVQLTDTLDPTLDATTLMVTPFNGTFTQSGSQIVFSVATIPADSSATITFQVKTTAIGVISNTAAITASAVQDPNSGNNTATTTTTVTNAADLSISVIPSPNPATIGGTLTYMVTVTNNGPSDATGADVTDTLPASVTYVSSSTTQGAQPTELNGVVTATLGPIANGATATITILVTPTISVALTNTATVVNPNIEIDPNLGNNTTSSPIVLVSPADLGVTITANPNPYVSPGTENYVATVTNHGPADATNVNLLDTLPKGFNVTAVNGVAMTYTGSSLTVAIGTIVSGQSATVTISGTSSLSGLVTNSVSVSGDQVDPNTGNNGASITSPYNPADVFVTLVANSKQPMVGDPYSYNATVGNNGQATATGVVFTFDLPSSVTYYGATTTAGTLTEANGVVTVSVGSLAAAHNVSIVIAGVPTVITSLTANAAVSATSYDPVMSNNTASVQTASTNTPGIFQLSSPSYVVSEAGGQVGITITRSNGTLGAVMVSYTTGNGTAISGINYRGVTSAIIFNPGDTSKTIEIPVLNDGLVTPNLTFYFAITGVNNGGVLGSPTAAAVTELNVNRDLVPPLVTNVVPIPVASGAIPSVEVFFDKAIIPVTATNTANYALFVSGRDGQAGANTYIPIVAASWNAANDSVTLIPRAPLAENEFYSLVINGHAGYGVTDTSGNLLDGANNGVAGTNYQMYVGIGANLKYVDSTGNYVNMELTGGGLMLMSRFLDGDGYNLQLLGTVPGHSVLNGQVYRYGNSSGVTSIQALNGLGHFGDVYSELTTPPFYVAEQVFTSPTGTPIIESAAVPLGPLAKKKK